VNVLGLFVNQVSPGTMKIRKIVDESVNRNTIQVDMKHAVDLKRISEMRDKYRIGIIAALLRTARR
jgi:hypothetical protein